MYYYISHLGGLYWSDKHYDYDTLYCEECGDSDTDLGWFETFEEAYKESLFYFGYDEEEIKTMHIPTKEEYIKGEWDD